MTPSDVDGHAIVSVERNLTAEQQTAHRMTDSATTNKYPRFSAGPNVQRSLNKPLR